MGTECQVNWKKSKSDSKAVPPKVMLGVPQGIALNLSTTLHLHRDLQPQFVHGGTPGGGSG